MIFLEGLWLGFLGGGVGWLDRSAVHTEIHTSPLRLHSPRILDVLVVGVIFGEGRGEGNARPTSRKVMLWVG